MFDIEYAQNLIDRSEKFAAKVKNGNITVSTEVNSAGEISCSVTFSIVVAIALIFLTSGALLVGETLITFFQCYLLNNHLIKK